MVDNTKRFSSSSILNELLESSMAREQKADIKTRGDHVISSAINLLDDILEEYGSEIAEKLERRFITAIKTRDTVKFKFNKK